MPRLFVAQQVAAAALVQIVAGQLEAGAQIVERLQNLQSPLGRQGHRLDRIGGQIGEGPGLGPPDPTPDLIQLRQAEHVGAVHDQRIRRRNIQPALDDGGGDQDVILPVVEGAHHLFQLGRAHLAVADHELHLRHLFAQEFLDGGQVLQARRDIVGLTPAIFLTQQSLAHQDRIPRRDIGPHRQAIDRRGGDDRHLADARQRHLKRARDRRGGQGQQMHVGAQGLQLLLVLDAEVLLLIDDDQAQIAEADLFAEHRVGADDDLH